MLCEKHLSGSWGSMVQASHGVPEMCSSLQTAGARAPCQGLPSVRRQQRANTPGRPNTPSCATGQSSSWASPTHPWACQPPPTTAMLSFKELNFRTSLKGVGFPEAQRVPKRHFQRSLSVVLVSEGSSYGIQILLESRPFNVEEWLK